MIRDPRKPWPHKEMVTALQKQHARYAAANAAVKEAQSKCEALDSRAGGDPERVASYEAFRQANERMTIEAFCMVGAVEAVLGVRS